MASTGSGSGSRERRGTRGGGVMRTLLPEGCGELEFLAALPTFDLVNGDASDVRPLFIKPTIPQPYYWVPVKDIEPGESMGALELYIKSEMAHLERNPLPDVSKHRKAAIVLGTARAVATDYYGVGPNDMIAGELAEPYFEKKKVPYSDTAKGRAEPELPEGATAEEKDERAVKMASEKEAFVRVGESTAAVGTILGAKLDLTDEEKNAISTLVTCSVGILPLQGYSLIMTGHHYLSDAGTVSRRAFQAVEKQFWDKSSSKSWFDADRELIQDALWHKACHPINMIVKERLARNEEVAKRLIDMKIGSAATRLPAVEPTMRAANSAITLLSTVEPMWKTLGAVMDYSKLEKVVGEVKKYTGSLDEEVNMVTLGVTLPPGTNSRRKALSFLDAMMEANKPRFAVAYGFYCALSEATQIGTSGASADTLRSANSLMKLANSYRPSYTQGMMLYSDYNFVRMRKRREGIIIAPDVSITIPGEPVAEE